MHLRVPKPPLTLQMIFTELRRVKPYPDRASIVSLHGRIGIPPLEHDIRAPLGLTFVE
jgi:hypothetical protein